jgi:hypothetical protein
MKRLRVLHQKEAVVIANELLAHHPRFSDICEAIDDHDTRENASRPEFRAFWDGDVLWRFTLKQVVSDTFGKVDISDPDAVFRQLCRQFHRNNFTLPLAYEIARREIVQTILYAEKILGWHKLPDFFCDIFDGEIAATQDRP